MRFATLLVAGAFAFFANAQSTTTAPTTTLSTTATAVSTDAAQASMLACLNACTPGDVDCTSKCIAVPNPNASQANATNNCVAECPKGNGTATDNLNYSNCVQGCIGQYYFTTSGTPAPTAGAGSGSSGSVSGGATTTGTATGTGSGSSTSTATGSAASSSKTGGAEPLRVAGSAVGLLGFVAALLAL